MTDVSDIADESSQSSAHGSTSSAADGLLAQDGRVLVQGSTRGYLRQDPAQLLEVAVLAAQTGWPLSSELARALARESGHILDVPRAQWQSGMARILLAPHAGTGLLVLHQAQILQMMLPEVASMADFHNSCPIHHKDIFDHTLQVIEKCPPVLAVRWAALMHDTGKVWTRTVIKGKVHFFRHEELGASLMEGVAGRFHLDPDLRDRVVYIISNHARANVYATDWTDSAVRRLIRDMGPNLHDVLAFSQSDFTTKRQWRIAEVRQLTEELNKRILEIAAADSRIPPLPKGLGHLIMTSTGLQGGPWLGEVTAWLEAEVEAGQLPGQLPAEAYLAYLQENRPDLLAIPADQVRQRRAQRSAAKPTEITAELK